MQPKLLSASAYTAWCFHTANSLHSQLVMLVVLSTLQRMHEFKVAGHRAEMHLSVNTSNGCESQLAHGG